MFVCLSQTRQTLAGQARPEFQFHREILNRLKKNVTVTNVSDFC